MPFCDMNDHGKYVTMMCPGCFREYRIHIKKEFVISYPQGMMAPVIKWDTAVEAWCPHCYGIYDEENIRLLTKEEIDAKKLGGSRMPLVHVDEGIIDAIRILNKKGYYTSFSCSGHIRPPLSRRWYPRGHYDLWRSENLPILTQGYVMFQDPWADKLDAPEGWKWDDNHPEGCEHFEGRDLQQTDVETLSLQDIKKWLGDHQHYGYCTDDAVDYGIDIYVTEQQQIFTEKCQALRTWAIGLPDVSSQTKNKIWF